MMRIKKGRIKMNQLESEIATITIAVTVAAMIYFGIKLLLFYF